VPPADSIVEVTASALPVSSSQGGAGFANAASPAESPSWNRKKPFSEKSTTSWDKMAVGRSSRLR
jgi:hypothetical protein